MEARARASPDVSSTEKVSGVVPPVGRPYLVFTPCSVRESFTCPP
jgi:hypothetical protein